MLWRRPELSTDDDLCVCRVLLLETPATDACRRPPRPRASEALNAATHKWLYNIALSSAGGCRCRSKRIYSFAVASSYKPLRVYNKQQAHSKQPAQCPVRLFNVEYFCCCCRCCYSPCSRILYIFYAFHSLAS